MNANTKDLARMWGAGKKPNVFRLLFNWLPALDLNMKSKTRAYTYFRWSHERFGSFNFISTAINAMLAALLLVFAAAWSCTAYAQIFPVYDQLNLSNKPDLIGTYGFSKIQAVGEGQLWPAGVSHDQPDEATVRSVARRTPSNVFLVIDIEAWPTQVNLAANPPVTQTDVNAAIQKYITVVDWMHNENPNLKVGYYSVLPIRNYWAPVSYVTVLNSGQTPSGSILSDYNAWLQANANLQVLASHVDAVFPSLYTFYDDPAGWQIYARENMKEAYKYGKPVFPYIWPRYHPAAQPPSLAGQYIDAAYWSTQLNTVQQFSANNIPYAQGMVIWDTGTWSPTATWLTPTQQFIATLKAVPQPSNKFKLSQLVQLADATAVYNKPSLSGTLLQTHNEGSPGSIFAGPVLANGLVWWNVNYTSGADGWSPEFGIGPPIPGLVGHWRLDEGSGIRTADSSGYYNTGTLLHNPLWTAGIEGKALTFNSANKSYVQFLDSDVFNFGTGDFTLSLWVYYQTAPTSAAFISKGLFVSTFPSYFLGIQNSGLVFGFAAYTGPAAQGGPAATYAGHWTHVAGVRSGNTLRLYINGVLKGTGAIDPTALNANVNNAFNLQLGARGDEVNYGLYDLMNGTIDEVAVYSRALNASEVNRLFAFGF